MAAIAGQMVVLTAMIPTVSMLLVNPLLDPMLNPYHPNHKRKAPKEKEFGLFGGNSFFSHLPVIAFL